jgi:hypothetical protein
LKALATGAVAEPMEYRRMLLGTADVTAGVKQAG